MSEEVEHLDGREIVRDEHGRFVKVKLSSETAREMNARSKEKRKEETFTTLLQEAGYKDEDDAPEHLKILAQIASSRRSGSVPAMRDFLRLTHAWDTTSDISVLAAPRPGELCPLCKGFNFLGIVGHEFGDLLREVRELELPDEASEAAEAGVGAG